MPARDRDEIPLATVLSLPRTSRRQPVEIYCFCIAPASARCKALTSASSELSAITVWKHETLSMQWFPSFSCTAVVDRRVSRSLAQSLSPNAMHSCTSFWYEKTYSSTGLSSRCLAIFSDLQRLCTRADHCLRAELQIGPIHADVHNEPRRGLSQLHHHALQPYLHRADRGPLLWSQELLWIEIQRFPPSQRTN